MDSTDPTAPYTGEYPEAPGDGDQVNGWADVFAGIWDRLTNPLPRYPQ